MPMVPRKRYLSSVQQALKRSPIVELLGPRQSGKTTLARQLLDEASANYFDLFFIHNGKRIDAPKTSRSMRIAKEDLKLDMLYVIYPGSRSFVLDDKIQALPSTDVRKVT